MFDLDKEQQEKASQFIKEHECSFMVNKYGFKEVGAIGGSTTYRFTPTSLGVIIKIDCTCGQSVDVTDYNW